MKPRGPLMIEHRLIEKMIELLKAEIPIIKAEQKVEPFFIDTVVDFIRIYADRTHHGKEEDILFKALESKNISEPDQKNMNELIEEHKYGRKLVAELVQAKEEYLAGDPEALATILEKFAALVEFYPEHIKKEDLVFFPDTEKYFTKEELDAMLEAFWEFDRNMIHEKYKNVVEQTRQKLGL